MITRLFSKCFLLLNLIAFCCVAQSLHTSVKAEEPLRVLLITGGCCHDYKFQTQCIQDAFKENKVAAEITVVDEGGKGTRAEIDLYKDPNWASKYDVVIHNECFADTTDPEYIRKITKAHEAGANAVVIHCAMHTYRATDVDDWRKFLGVTSRRHDHQSKYPVKVVAPEHPIMQGFKQDWITPMDELYVIETVWPNAKALATSVSEKDGQSHPVFWTNEFGKARVFGTTFGHSNETFADKSFQQALVRGSLWAAGKIK